jgi:hypothetical protein
LKIASHGTLQQKLDLAKNPLIEKCPEAIFTLYQDRDDRVHSALKKEQIEIALTDLATHGTEIEKIALTEHWNLRNHPKVTEILSKDPSKAVRLALANNKDALIHAPQATLSLLADAEQDIRERTASHEQIIKGLAGSGQEAVLLSLVKCNAVIERYPDLADKFSQPTMFKSVRLALAGDVHHLIFVTQAKGEYVLGTLRNDPDKEVRNALRASTSSPRWIDAFKTDPRLVLYGAELGIQGAHAALM